jgi:thiosulfate reductase cytochrome b subunit
MAETAHQQPGGHAAPASDAGGQKLHPLPLRVMHWINAVAIIIMIMSGIKIYNDSPIFGWLYFPSPITLGGDPDIAVRFHSNGGQSGALQWHFLGMWIVVINGLAYLTYGIVTGRLRRKLLPIWPSEVIGTIRDALRLKLGHDDITVYNGVQKVLYAGIIVVAMIEVLAGLLIWKPVQFSSMTWIFYSFQGARLVHFFGMTAIVLFLFVHVLLALLVPKTLLAMITGGPRVGHAPPPPAALAASSGE